MNLSRVSHSKINWEEKREHVSKLRMLYTLFALQLIIALVWASFALSYLDPFGNGILKYWWIALITGILAVVILVLLYFVAALRKKPLSMVMYILFTLFFMYTVGYFCLLDKTYLVYYALWLLTAIAIGFAIYAWAAPNGMSSLIAMAVVLFACLFVFLGFLIFTNVSFIGLSLVLLVVLIFGFYLHYDIRKMVRGGVNDYNVEDPWAGAVTIWGDGLLVFFRFFELLGRACCRTN